MESEEFLTRVPCPTFNSTVIRGAFLKNPSVFRERDQRTDLREYAAARRVTPTGVSEPGSNSILADSDAFRSAGTSKLSSRALRHKYRPPKSVVEFDRRRPVRPTIDSVSGRRDVTPMPNHRSVGHTRQVRQYRLLTEVEWECVCQTQFPH